MFSLLAPYRAPGFVSTYSFNSTTIIVRWNYLPNGDFQGEPIGYIISFRPVDLRSAVIVVKVNNTTNTTTLTNLKVYTMYVINVSAVSSGGIGPANTARAQTNASGTNDIHCKNIAGCARGQYEANPMFCLATRADPATPDCPL